MKAVLARLWPLDPVTGDRIEVCVSAHGDGVVGRKINGLGGLRWVPAITQPPALRISLFDGAFASAVSVAQAGMQINVAGPLLRAFPNIGRYAWAGAKVEIYAQDPDTAWPWPAVFVGKVASYARAAQSLTLSLQIDTEPFQADVLSAKYAGTGGAEGSVDLAGRVKPLVIGWALNVEPVLIDATNSVYQFSGYGPIEEVVALFERGSDFGPEVADYADYAALVAASIPPGTWGTCLAEGMIRLGAPAYGVITGDVKGHKVGASTPRLTGAVIAELANIADLDSALINASSLSALDTAVPYPINLVLDSQVSVLEIAQKLALPCNAQAGIGLDGRLFAARINLAASAQMTLHAQGKRKPLVTDSREEYVSPPFWRTVLGANRCWRVHSKDEIAFEAPFVPRGLYDPAETYREGQFVDIADGSQWLYIYPTPTSGNAPPTWPTASNTWWSNLRPPITAEGISVPRHDPASGSATFTANYAGALDADQLPFTIQFKRLHGITDRSGDATWSIVSQGSITGVTVTVADGVVSIPSGAVIPPATEIEVKSVIDGYEISSKIAVTRLDAAPPSTGGTGGPTTVTDNTLNSVSNTTMVALSDVMTVKTGSGGTITFAGVLSIIAAAASPDGVFGAQMRWKYRPVGGSFSDVGSVINETVEAEVFYEELGEPPISRYFRSNGSINVAESQTGLSANTDYEVQLWGARDTSTPTKTLSFGGTVSAAGS